MKKLAITFTMICLAMLKCTFPQIIPDAGPDRVVCVGFSAMDTILIGGSPSATGGTTPYTYTWEADYTWSIGNHTFNFSASDFLNDTTLANPNIINAIGDTIEFRLTVTDSAGNIAHDTTTVYFAYFWSHLGYTHYTINQGDSVFLYGWENIFGGFPPYEYLWRPNHGLTDSTSLKFWAKPEYSLEYYMTLTDSAGCVVTGAPVYYINVKPLHAEEHTSQKPPVKVYPNPAKDFLNIQINPAIQGEFSLRLFLGNGKLMREQRFSENELRIEVLNYPSGIYIYEITNNKGFNETGQIIIR